MSCNPPCPAATPEERGLPAERLVHVQETADSGDGSGSTVCVYSYEIPPPAFGFEHDVQRRVFRVRSSHGEVSVFRDRLVRYLAVRPDPKTGELMPVTKRGEPVFMYLCREERRS
jgi:hypothetical protein